MTAPTKRNFCPFLAIDLLDGQVVRLKKGKYDQVTVYYEQPLELVKHLLNSGVHYLHLVDLNKARQPQDRVNQPLIKKIIEKSVKKVVLQLGGGLRTIADLQQVNDLGVHRMILGTAAFTPILGQALEKFGAKKILVALDIDQGIVKSSGWEKKIDLSLADAIQQIASTGVEQVIFTDIERDGMMVGPGTTAMNCFENSQLDFIVSGGIASIDDVRHVLTNSRANGVIIGRAYYEGKITEKMIASLTT